MRWKRVTVGRITQLFADIQMRMAKTRMACGTYLGELRRRAFPRLQLQYERYVIYQDP